jgi:hemoglobin
MRRKYLLVAVLALAAACGGGKKSDTTGGGAPPAGKLFDRLGGETGIKGVVKDFVENNVANADIPGLEKKLYEQICNAADGGCVYSGKDMKTAHASMKITEADFNALVEDLVKALDNAHVADADKKALLGVLGPMKSDIVTVH